MIKIINTGDFDQMYRELIDKEPLLSDEISQIVSWFRKNPKDTRLDNHLLTKRMEERWAFSITEDTRIVYEWLGKTTVRFLAIGKHKKVYQKKPRL